MAKRPAIMLSYGTYLLVGSVLTVLGPLVPEIINYYGISYSALGTAMVFNSLSYLPAVLLGGLMCGRYGAHRVNIIGLLGMVLGYGTMALAESWWLFVAGYCLGGGLGFGLVEAGLNALVMGEANVKQGAALNMLHVFAAVGAIGGPIVARALVALTGEWQWVYIGLTVVFLFAAMVFMFYRLPESVSVAETEKPSWIAMLHALYIPVIGILALAMTFYVGVEIGLSSWMYTYIVTEVGGGALLGATLNALFWVGLGLGRLLSTHFSEKVGYERFLFWGAFTSSIALLPALIWRVPLVVSLSFFCTGLLFAGTFPTILAVGAKAVSGSSGPVAGALIFFAGVGTMVFPPAMGQLADLKGISYAMLLAYACSVALTISTALLWSMVRVHRHPQNVPQLLFRGED